MIQTQYKDPSVWQKQTTCWLLALRYASPGWIKVTEAEWPADVALFLNLDQRSIGVSIKQGQGGEAERQGAGAAGICRRVGSATHRRPVPHERRTFAWLQKTEFKAAKLRAYGQP